MGDYGSARRSTSTELLGSDLSGATRGNSWDNGGVIVSRQAASAGRAAEAKPTAIST